MKIKTIRFGEIEISENDILSFPEPILGFNELTKYCLVDPNDDTLILWLQSIEDPRIAFPVLEPKVFKTDYVVKLSGQELKQLQLSDVNQSVVFTILTIPKDINNLTANLKAPIVINLKNQLAKQVVLQENEYSLKHLMFKELKAHLATIAANQPTGAAQNQIDKTKPVTLAVDLKSMLPSKHVQTL